MQFGYIAPTDFIDKFDTITRSNFHLVLAHLVESDPKYVAKYNELKSKNPNLTVVMDNSGYELYKEGKPMFDPTKLVDLGKKIQADYIVLPDFPGEEATKTREKMYEYAPLFRANGFGTFYVPQSKVGDVGELVNEVVFALSCPLIDYIGVSILAVPNAYGVEKDNKLQRYLSRPHFMKRLDRRLKMYSPLTLEDVKKKYNKKIHFLGMVDGPNEIGLMQDLIKEGVIIDTWDSSSPVWAGISGVSYDGTPTGLINGKIETAVDFATKYNGFASDRLTQVLWNLDRISSTVSEYNVEVEWYHFNNEPKTGLQVTGTVTAPAVVEMQVTAPEPKEFPFRFFEGESVAEITEYIKATYSQHYVADEGEEDVQAIDVWKGLGSLETTSRDTALKYLMRFGKKDGKNRKDLLKAVHYIILMMSENRGNK